MGYLLLRMHDTKIMPFWLSGSYSRARVCAAKMSGYKIFPSQVLTSLKKNGTINFLGHLL